MWGTGYGTVVFGRFGQQSRHHCWHGEMGRRTYPNRSLLPITKDQSVCDPNSAKNRDLERLEVGEDGLASLTPSFILHDIVPKASPDGVIAPRTDSPLDQ